MRFAKFLRAINCNRFFACRIVFAGRHTSSIHDAPEEDDTRETLIVDEQNLQASFSTVMDVLITEPISGIAGEIHRGLATGVMTFFIVQLLRSANAINYSAGDLSFPVDLYSLIDNNLSVHQNLYSGTCLRDRFAGLQLMMEIDGINPDNRLRVREAVQKLKNPNIRQFLRGNWKLRLRIYDLYQDIRPYLLGTLTLKEQPPSVRRKILECLGLLLKQLAHARDVEKMSADRRTQIRDKVEKRLAQSIGANHNHLGRHIYRGLRGGTQTRLRTDYLFQTLLREHDDRLAVLNVIYTHKKSETPPSHPQYGEIDDLFLGKYQQFFPRTLIRKPAGDGFLLTEDDFLLGKATT